MSKQPLVSLIVPTYNSANTLKASLESIKNQDYPFIELIVVDNNSRDSTKTVARKYTSSVFNKGPERSAQRNYGVSKASGEYVFIIDSDMQLDQHVVSECVEQFKAKEIASVVIPEESFGKGFWAECKKLERSFYVGVSWMEAARAFRREIYQRVGGYDESMVSGEDWDLSQRVEALGKIGRINSFIFHNEGKLKLGSTLKKKYYYAQKFAAYHRKNSGQSNVSLQTGPVIRYKLFFSQPKKLFKSPLLGIGMIFMKTTEFGAGALAMVRNKK